MANTWVVTRAQPDADSDVAALRAIGQLAVAIPCIERIGLPWPAWDPPGARVVLISSSFGAMELAKAWPTMSPKPMVAAMAPATAARLELDGIPVTVRAEGGIVALATALRAWHGGGALSILYPTSDAGAEQPEQAEAIALLRTFATVDRAAVYSTRAPSGLDAALQNLTPPFSWLFMSPSAVDHALSRCQKTPEQIVCVGQSTLRRCSELLANAPATHYPSFGAFLTALTSRSPT